MTGQNVEGKNKRMFMERFHETLTRQICATLGCLVENGQGNWEGMTSGTRIYKKAVIDDTCSFIAVL